MRKYRNLYNFLERVCCSRETIILRQLSLYKLFGRCATDNVAYEKRNHRGKLHQLDAAAADLLKSMKAINKVLDASVEDMVKTEKLPMS